MAHCRVWPSMNESKFFRIISMLFSLPGRIHLIVMEFLVLIWLETQQKVMAILTSQVLSGSWMISSFKQSCLLPMLPACHYAGPKTESRSNVKRLADTQ
eukprot:3402451-Amphidinium_carterae.1